MGIFDKIREGLKKTRDNISGQITQMVNSFTKIDEELFEELEELLVMGDVGVTTAGHICDTLRRRVKEEGVKDPNAIMGLLQETVRRKRSGPEKILLQGRKAGKSGTVSEYICFKEKTTFVFQGSKGEREKWIG